MQYMNTQVGSTNKLQQSRINYLRAFNTSLPKKLQELPAITVLSSPVEAKSAKSSFKTLYYVEDSLACAGTSSIENHAKRRKQGSSQHLPAALVEQIVSEYIEPELIPMIMKLSQIRRCMHACRLPLPLNHSEEFVC